jgi:hypothetical protein
VAGRACAALSLCTLLCLPLQAQVSARQEGDIYTLENPHFRLEIDARGGARVRSWVLKPGNREMIALWQGPGEIGGALDDRAIFTAARYDAAIMHPGPDTAILRFEARHASGLAVVKTLTARRDSPALEIHHRFANGTQVPQVLFLRSMLLPGAKPQTDEHLYWVNVDPASGSQPVVGDPAAANYYRPAPPEFAALWHRGTGDGVVALAPGASRFYFWRDSRECPTFEWLYEELPPGKVLEAGVFLATVCGAPTAPDWQAVLRDAKAAPSAARVSDLPGWVDEATRFQVTAAERERGFWLSCGEGEGRQRLPDPLPLDLPLEETRYLGITLNLLKPLGASVRLEVPGEWEPQVTPLWETPGDDRRELLPLPAGPVRFEAGSREVLWLRLDARGKPAGEHRLPLRLDLGGEATTLSVALRLWPVRLAARRPFHVRGYWTWATIAGGYEPESQTLAHYTALLKAYAEMGGDVLDWTHAWHEVVSRTRLAQTGEKLAEVAKSAPDRLDLEHLPALDFAHFDPWLDAALKLGVNRLETYIEALSGERWQWSLLDPAVGAGRAKAGAPEARRVIVWFYGELRRYLEAKGFQGLFCKVSDEISPEYIPTYIECARVAREAGWRPFTTITGMVARTAADVRQLNPHCDQWQLGFGSKDAFLALLHERAQLAEERRELRGTWGLYTNGGAEATWALAVFGAQGETGIDPATVETLELIEDGKPLPTNGDSPWGNRRRGVVFTAGALGTYLYVSPADGQDPAGHRYALRLTVRRPTAEGQPLVGLEPTDELWFYGGGSHPYRGGYANAWLYPVMVLHHGFQGYGQWAFLWWQRSERILWLDEGTGQVTVSPAYCGYRDGWRDALILGEVRSACGEEALRGLLGPAESALLHVVPQTVEVYQFTTLGNAGDPVAVNRARAKALELLARR